MRPNLPLLATLLLLSSTALADQAYIQASAWAVNYLPVMPGQSPHQRCILQSTYSGDASIQLITEGMQVKGAIVILTEPVFKVEGRSISVVLSLGDKAWEFPARTLSKYAVAIEISDAYEAAFRSNLSKSDVLTLKSGFTNYTFSIQDVAQQLENALACKAPAPPKPVIVQAPPPKPEVVSPLTPMPDAAPAPKLAMPTPVPQTPATNVIVGGKHTPGPDKAFFVQGDGRDVPLSEALPRILPPDYKFALAQGASASERISWAKGGDWLETLIIALDDAGLQAAATGKTVTVLPKLKPMTMPVTSSTRASVIVKEPGALGVDAPVVTTDPSKPPSMGMQKEADALLSQLRLDPDALNKIAQGNNEKDKMKPILSEEDGVIVPLPDKPGVEKPALPEKPSVADPLVAKAPAVIGADETVFRASKGEKVSDVLARWAQQDGADLDADLQRDYFLAHDITVQGDLELAVQQALSQFKDLPDMPRIADDAAASADTQVADTGGATGTFAGAKKTPTTVPPVIQPEEEHTALQRRLGLIAGWNAVQGTSLRAALTNWSRQAQMSLIWESPEDVIVDKSVSGTKRLEDALDQLLSQYDDAAQKPSIQINHDPETGQTAMIVDVQSFQTVPKDSKKSK